MSRRFDGTDDEIRFAVQASSNFTGAVTLAAVLRRRSVGAWHAIIQHATSSGTTNALNFEWNGGGSGGTTNALWFDNDTQTVSDSNAITSTTDWYLVAVTKAAGTIQPRFHIKNLTTGAAWIHNTPGVTVGNAASHSGGSIRIGEWLDGDDADYNLAVDAGWSTALSDGQIESLTANLRTQDFLDLSPVYCHQHNQATATEDIEDLTGNGHTASGTISGATDTSGIQGTSMDTATDPPSWIYYAPGGGSSGGGGYAATAGQWDVDLNGRMWF